MQIGGKRMIRSAIWAILLVAILCAPAAADTLNVGSKNSAAVLQLQLNLREKGYLAEKFAVNGVYSTTIRNAVGVFQIANNIKPAVALGVADDLTQERLASADAVRYSEYLDKLMDAQLKLGGSGSYVKTAQTRLRALGYYSGKVDGRYQATTAEAVRLFQLANGLTNTGAADKATRAVLYGSAPVTRAQYDAINFLTPLGAGAKGGQVEQLQKQLAAKHFYWGDPTGVYDAQTRCCVKFFQEANGLSATGSASRTLRALANGDASPDWNDYTKDMKLLPLSTSAKPGVKVAVLQLQLRDLGYYKGLITGAYSSAVVSAVRTFQIFNNLDASLITGKANLATREALAGGKALSYSEVCGSDTLKSGQTGDAVKALQTRLKALGYYTGAIDGKYDSDVAAAVKRFQKLNGLTATGIAYTTTLTQLSSEKAVSYTNLKIDKLLAVAVSRLGCPYDNRNPRAPYSFDCSRFTKYCFSQVGVDISGEVATQGKKTKGTRIDKLSELKPGDLVFFDTQTDKKPGHAAIYIGDYYKKQKGWTKAFIHASSAAGIVTVTSITKDWYKDRFMWGVRIWE